MYFRTMPSRALSAVGTGLLVLTSSACEVGVVDRANGGVVRGPSPVAAELRGDGWSLGVVDKPPKSPKQHRFLVQRQVAPANGASQAPEPSKPSKPSKPTVPSSAGEPVRLTAFFASTVDCEGREVIVGPFVRHVELEGTCPLVTVESHGSEIFVRSVGTLVVNGNVNDLSCASGLNGAAPSVRDHGRGNSFTGCGTRGGNVRS